VLQQVKQEAAKTAGDVTAVTVTVGALLEYLPAAAAAATLIWTLIRIYETQTVQRAIRRMRGES
jgi:hypothetical protein